jgi:hypothetical protein
MTFVDHLRKERYKLVLSSLTASIGFLIALLVNSAIERHGDRQAYYSLQNAIRVEAQSNERVLHDSFDKYFDGGLVLQEFNTAVVSQALSSPTFLKNSTKDEIAGLSSYVRNLTLANRYRERSEKWRLEEKEDWVNALTKVWNANLDACQKSITAVSRINENKEPRQDGTTLVAGAQANHTSWVRGALPVSTQDRVLIWQTFIAAVTGAVVIIYTYVTWRVQKNAQQQNRLLNEQLELTKGELKRKEERERREAEPFIRWRGGSSTAHNIRCDFENAGANIFDLELVHPTGMNGTISHSQTLLRFEQGSVSFAGIAAALPMPLMFEIHYATRLAERYAKHFILEKSSETPREVKTLRST